MNKRIIIFIALVFGSLTGLMAQTYGEIHGKVLDERGEPLMGVMVIASAGAGITGDQTDFDGKFRIKPLDPGLYSLSFRSTGKIPVELKGVIVDPNTITFTKDIVVKDSTLLMTGIEFIYYIDPLISADCEVTHTLRSKEIKNLPSANAGNVKNIVASMSSEIKVSADGEELYFRGSRSGSVIYFIDGVKVRENVPNIPSSGLSRVSVYTGGLPAKYGDTTGGVVVIETKSYLEDYYQKNQ